MLVVKYSMWDSETALALIYMLYYMLLRAVNAVCLNVVCMLYVYVYFTSVCTSSRYAHSSPVTLWQCAFTCLKEISSITTVLGLSFLTLRKQARTTSNPFLRWPRLKSKWPKFANFELQTTHLSHDKKSVSQLIILNPESSLTHLYLCVCSRLLACHCQLVYSFSQLLLESTHTLEQVAHSNSRQEFVCSNQQMMSQQSQPDPWVQTGHSWKGL